MCVVAAGVRLVRREEAAVMSIYRPLSGRVITIEGDVGSLGSLVVW